ncbi:GNAT family N-acetyltransferase [Aestuariibius sp. 2305UL40-4]|uniref:GNAT family N-acetyltransferase n=1 Tax=Aestuariibius violaceus TaxID=3234132 RepID=UPI00345F0CA7
MADTITIRIAAPKDLAALDALYRRSYPALLKAHYPPSVYVTAVPLLARAQPRLMRSGQFFVAEDAGGALLGAGGWSFSAPQGGELKRTRGHVRHFAVDPSHVRRGIASALMMAVKGQADARGIARLDCLSTRMAVPFYEAQGFRVRGEIDVPLRPGISFPAVSMRSQITS